MRPFVVFVVLWTAGVIVFGLAIAYGLGKTLVDAARYGYRRLRRG